VNAEKVLVGGAIGFHDVVRRGDFFAEEEFVEQAEFLRWENVCAEIEIVAWVVDEFEWEHGWFQKTF
jgi:hypothetical protein